MEVCQQIMSQIGQQDVTFLSQEEAFSAGREVETALVIAELFDFSRAALVIIGQKQPI